VNDEEGKHEDTVHSAALPAAVALGLLAWLTPLDVLGMLHMFTLHMAQHLLLSLVVPPLLIIGAPSHWLARLFQQRYTGAVLRRLTRPFTASLLFNGTIWLLHAPGLMYLIMQYPALHETTNLLYLGAGLLFWWPLLNRLPEGGRSLGLSGKLAYLFFSDMPMMLLGAGMTFSRPLYTMPMDGQISMVVPVGDQQLGGLLMWIDGNLYFIVIAGSLFLRWMLQQERLEVAAESSQE
jgi:putative membrane protein